MSRFLKAFNPLIIIQRNTANRRYNWANEGIQYYGFKYYPRTPDFKDPPYEPSKLLRVERIKPLKGVPFYEKIILKQFGLDGVNNDFKIIKNIPENNQRLWRIKHLIQIRPVTFPNGFPTNVDGTYLKENGELVIRKTLANPDEKLQLSESFSKNLKRMDGETLRRDSRKKWLIAWE